MTEPLVLSERGDGYAVLTLNRPDKRNAVSVALADEFVAALGELEDCPVIVLTGAGNKSFCAGVDLKERAGRPQTWSASFGTDRAQYWAETVDVMRRHPAVFIAAVNGFALGGGLTLVNTAELAVAARSARFGMPELGFASFPALAGPTSVHRILPKHVSELAFLPGNIDADRAMAIGLVNEVVDDAALMDRAREMATQVARYDPIALGHTKRGLRVAERLSWVDAIENGAVTAALIKAEQRAAKPVPAGENGHAGVVS